MNPQLQLLLVITKLEWLFKVEFISHVETTHWVSSMILMRKMRVCVDYEEPNACAQSFIIFF